MIRELWKALCYLPKKFKELRDEKKYEKNLIRIEREEGLVGAFLHVFETEWEVWLPAELCEVILTEFAKQYHDKRANNQLIRIDSIANIISFNAYCAKYGAKGIEVEN
tara:strand:+ start:598 stop:921 length:324 start_codon:yes stop_codon:yes gene_type:complete